MSKTKKPNGPVRNVRFPGLPDKPDESYEELVARAYLSPDFGAGLTAQLLTPSRCPPADLGLLIEQLRTQALDVVNGKLARGEGMLAIHAHILDQLFQNLTRRAIANADEGYLSVAETFMRLALKAQSQSRMTWEAIAEIKNPRAVAFVKQANIAAGHQQVNNGVARENQTAPTELSGGAVELRENAGTSAPAIGVDPAMAAVGTINGAAIARGQGDILAEPKSGADTPDASGFGQGSERE